MILYDNIHGYINIDELATSIINTPIFQRLRYIHQTGILYMVFPSATHTRFEHSIGTYYLAKQMIETLARNNPDCNITERIIKVVSIAGLCHDIGHLIFSHLFDDLFLKKLPYYSKLQKQTSNTNHENRSVFLLNYIVDNYNIDLSKDELLVIKDLINPKDAIYDEWLPEFQVGKWIFQIISNNITGIDVDKFDYITRDTVSVGLKIGFNFTRIINDAKIINDTICYSQNCSEDIYHMFFIRYRLFREIYNHKCVKSIELYIIKILFELESELGLSNYILTVDKMIELTDYFVWTTIKNDNIKNLINNINCRNLLKLAYQNITITNVNYDNLVNKIKDNFDTEKFYTIKFNVGYGSNKLPNPLNSIRLYNAKDISKTEILTAVNNFSLLLNQKHREYFFRIYCTKDIYNELVIFINKNL